MPLRPTPRSGAGAGRPSQHGRRGQV